MKKEYTIPKIRWISLVLVLAGMLMVLSGCGRDEAVSTGAQTQESFDSSEDSTAQIAVLQQNAAVQQSEMDEEIRHQLTAELLEENELDTSIIENERTTRGCTFDIPEGFEESEEVDNLYVTARYPLDTSMIYYEVMDGNTSLQLMTKEMFKEQAEENLHQAYGEDTKIDIDSYESVKISGYPAFRILCHYEVQSIKITQLEYIINADKTYAITYSQTSDIDWMEAFEASAATIRVK